MYKNLIIGYINKLTKNDIYNFKEKNNLNITDKDIDIIYLYIKKYKNEFFDNPNKYIAMIKNEVTPNCYKEILKYYDKYKKSI